VAIAPGRTERPGATRALVEAPAPDELDSCPFCRGHEEMTPPQTLVLPEKGDWRVRVVPNLYPALERQEVVIQSPDHVRSIADLDDEGLELVADAWQRRRASVPGGYLQAVLNEGRLAGASLPHSHSQLAWLPSGPPPEPAPHGETIVERDGVVAWSPYVARVPYELAVRPVEADGSAFRSRFLGAGLRVLAALVRRLHALEGPVPLNAWLHDEGAGWRLILFPRLSILAALELSGAVSINTLAPEEAAERLSGGEG
jgi:UDPglucose--hexose-1-phosphate uridylyltransferase